MINNSTIFLHLQLFNGNTIEDSFICDRQFHCPMFLERDNKFFTFGTKQYLPLLRAWDVIYFEIPMTKMGEFVLSNSLVNIDECNDDTWGEEWLVNEPN
jgi:hypothetical protein